MGTANILATYVQPKIQCASAVPKRGHFAKVCRSNSVTPFRGEGASAAVFLTLAAVHPHIPSVPLKSSIKIGINCEEVKALIDYGSTESLIYPDLV